MKKLFFFLAFVAMSVLSFGQNQLVWANGKLLYGTPIESIDSLTYNEMQDIDTLHLLLPRMLVQVLHDTVYIHDTVYVNIPEGGQDTVSPTTDPYNGHEYVDLGLPSGLKWATCNIGASIPEEFGDYYAWGEVEPKETYSVNNYKWYIPNSSNYYTKYSTSYDSGVNDGKIILEADDDAATVNWGGSWRMPTYEEWLELCENCTWLWTTQNEVNGYLVKSKTNDNSIFLPAAGSSSAKHNSTFGCYWSCSLDLSSRTCSFARHLKFTSEKFEIPNAGEVGGSMRAMGMSVRPVCPLSE